MSPADPFSVTSLRADEEPVYGNRTERVAKIMTQKIRANELPPGSRLPSENALAQHFGVSRTVIREAMASLKAEGLVESHQGSGVFVCRSAPESWLRIRNSPQDSIRSLLNVIEVRRGIEAEMAALAATRRSLPQLEEIRQSLAGITEAVKLGRNGVEEDIAFHKSIARATNNQWWLEFVEFFSAGLGTAIKVTRANEARREDFAQQVQAEHEKILAAITEGDSEAARRAAAQHMEQASHRIIAADRSFWQGEAGQLLDRLVDLEGAAEKRGKRGPR